MICRWLLAAFLAASAGAAFAQEVFPRKPIRFILPNAPGGSNSFVARLIGEKLTAIWGQQVLLDNRPGGHNVIAAEALLRSNPDGHTILLVTASHAINPLLFRDQPYEFLRDFASVGSLTSTQYILAVNATAVPASNLREFVAFAKSKPAQLNAAGSNSGGIQHLALELFNVLAGVKLNYVPYKGGGPGMTDLVGGHVQLAFNNAITLSPHLNSGKVRALAIGGEARSPVLPNVPTFAEAGVGGFNVKNWFGVVAPARTPKTIVKKLSDEIARIQTMPDINDKLVSQGAEPFISGPEQFAAFYKTEMTKFAKIIKVADIRIEH
ncbi:MAG TPA: tripartite tricarboxylate transporter substrate binding protein [Burkholderiales bacterium]|nr:tripartite tricarboxylate transporter substrate binding protein [Burkholderiales bacterium]